MDRQAHVRRRGQGCGRVAAFACAVSTSPSAGQLFGSDGEVFTFRDAPFLGSLGDVHLHQPFVGGIGF